MIVTPKTAVPQKPALDSVTITLSAQETRDLLGLLGGVSTGPNDVGWILYEKFKQILANHA